MDTQTFLNEFGRLADIPNGIEKIRRLILQLAVQGKLGTGNSQDEPVNTLYAKIRSSLSKQKEIKIVDPLYPIPDFWMWTCLGNIGFVNPTNSVNDALNVAFVPMPLISADYRKPVRFETRLWKEIKKGYTHFANDDVVLAKITPCFQNGKSTVMQNLPNGVGAGTTELHVFRPVPGTIVPEYVLIYLKSSKFISDGIPRMTGTAGQKRVPKDYFSNSPFPLPPFEEQKRIVEKVDQLMALCDQLEAQQQEKKQLRAIMNTASLQALTKAQTQPEIHHAWQRIKDHFHSLYNTPETIPQLRQAILGLAIEGYLLSRDSPSQRKIYKASDLIKKIKAGKSPQTLQRPALDSEWGVLKISAVTWNEFQETENKALPPDIELWDDSEVKEGDLIITRCNTRELVGATVIVKKTRSKLLLCDKTLRLDIDEKIVNKDYFKLVLSSPQIRQYFSDNATGTSDSMRNISQEVIRGAVIALPPLNIQIQIVQKIGQLMAVCDQLAGQLKQAETDGSLLVETMIQRFIEGTQASSEATQTFNVNTSNLTDATKQAAVVTYIVSHLRNDTSLGDLKVAKILFLLQEHIHIPLGYQYTKPAKAQLQLQVTGNGAEYQKWAAGPFDKALYTDTQPEGERKQWFVAEKRTGGGHRYKLAQKAQEGFELGKAILQPKMAEIDALMKPLAKLQTDDIEIVATLYAAWKELIQKAANRNKDSVLKGFYAWSEKKKQYAPGVVEQWLGWMQDYGITPEPLNILTGATV